MAQPEVIKDIEARVKKSGDTMTGSLTINHSWPTINLLDPNSSKAIFQVNPDANNVYLGMNNSGIIVGPSDLKYLDSNSVYQNIYHTGYKPNFEDVNAISNRWEDRYYIPSGSDLNVYFNQHPKYGGYCIADGNAINNPSSDTTWWWYFKSSIGKFASNLSTPNKLWWRWHINENYGPWNELLHSNNFNQYALPLTGGTLTGSVTFNGISYFKNKVFIGNSVPNNELIIHGAFSSTDAGFQDGNDRPGLKILGHYPQIVLMSGGAGNVNHGPTISLGAYDSGTTGSFKTFTIGTQGINCSRLDIGFGTATNPHANCMHGSGGAPIMRFESDRRTYQYGMASFCNHSADTSYMNSAIQIREANYAGAGADNWGTAPRVSFHWGGRVQIQIGLASNNQLYISNDNFSSRHRIVYENDGLWEISTTGYSRYLLDERQWNSNTAPTYGSGYLEYFNTHASICGGGVTAAGNTSSVPTDDWYYVIRMNHENGNGYYSEIASCFHNNNMYWRRVASGGSTNWMHIWVEGNSVTGAVWNDYAECREADTIEPGYVLIEKGDDTLTKSTERLQPFAGISSDTWGFSQGETDKAKTPIAVAGRVLVYTYRDRNEYKPGDCVCAAPGGTIDIMTREEIINYPDRIVGTVSNVPNYETWGGGEGADREPVDVNGRIWIKVR